MSFAVRPIGLASNRDWTYVGASSVSTSGTISFPATAQAGDLAVWCGSYSVGGSPPSGWTLIASGSSLQAYKICAGGETSASWVSPYTTKAQILLFRPVGGAASLHDGKTDSPVANRSMSAGASKSVVVAIGNYTGSIPGGWSPTLPGSWSNTANSYSGPALYVSWRFMAPGESTGTMNIGGSRQTFGIWGLT